MESLLFALVSIAVLIAAYMGLRDDRRPPGAPQTSLFRTFDYDNDDRPKQDDDDIRPKQGGRITRGPIR